MKFRLSLSTILSIFRVKTAKKKIVQSIACRLWFCQLAHELGTMDPLELEASIFDKGDFCDPDIRESLSRNFYHYRNGEQFPNKKTREACAIKAPQAEMLLQSPLWDILQNPDAKSSSIEKMFSKVSGDIKQHVFSQRRTGKPSQRVRIKSIVQAQHVARYCSIDALAILLITIRESELMQDFETFIDCKWEVNYILPIMALPIQFRSIATDIYNLIYDDFICRLNPIPTSLLGRDARTNPALYFGPQKKYDLKIKVDEYLDLLHSSAPSGYKFRLTSQLLSSLYDGLFHTKRDELNDIVAKIREDGFEVY